MSPNCKFNRQDGFSMMELIISLSVMTIVTGAAFALIGGSLRFANATYHMTDAEQSLRSAHEVIGRDLTSTGDGLYSVGTITVPLTFLQNYLTRTPVGTNLGLVTSDDGIPAGIAVPQVAPATTFQTNSDRISMLTKDTSFANVSVAAGKITQSGSNTNIVVAAGDIGRFQVGEIYAIVSDNAAFGVISAINSVTFTLTLTNGDIYSINQTGTTSPIYGVSQMNSSFISLQPVSIIRLQIIQYYVNASGLLMRRVFGVKGAGFVDSVVAEHVTNLQFRYLTNLPDANGFVQQRKRVISTPQEQTAVREIETTVAVETARAVNAVTNSNSNSSICGANPNGKQVTCSTTATSVRNLQFRNALSP